MKKLRTLITFVATLSMMLTAMSVAVSADTTTDLESMTVYAVDSAGERTEVSMDFSSTTYTYDLTVMSDTVSIEIEAEPADATSTWAIEKDGINTVMDFGTNYTAVVVTSQAGATARYELNTTKLTAEEEATYESSESTGNSGTSGTKKNGEDTTVTVDDTEMKISSSIQKSLIPEGFERSTAEYNGEEYPCIKGEVKDLTAFYLYNDETEGFYIYDSENDEFYEMHNIQIKSRMYTIVNPDETDKLLSNYEKKTVTIIDQEVSAWVLDEEEGMYLVYAMNWNGDTSLYSYDDNEKCFQRYLVSSDANTQMEAANKAYDSLQDKYNSLVDKYNMLLKIICGLVVIIIILIFVVINLAINKKVKKIKSGKKDKNNNDKNSENQEDTEEKKGKDKIAEEELPTNGVGIAEQPEEMAEEFADIDDIDNVDEIKEIPRRRHFGRKTVSDRGYGDEPTFGSDKESEEGFYGGEIEDEDEVLIDISDDEPASVSPEEIEKNMEEAQQKAEEDLKETLKSMLPEDTEDEDDDFEFIDLN